jgi:hypothetical protein
MDVVGGVLLSDGQECKVSPATMSRRKRSKAKPTSSSRRS